MKKNPNAFERIKNQIEASNNTSAFPKRTVINPERREERITEQMVNALDKGYEERLTIVRPSRDSIDPSLWLREQYTNEAGQMICQICKGEMPFKKRDGQYYFEAVEAFSRDHFPKEHEAQFLALCPLCAAMYKEFIKKDEMAMTELRKALLKLNMNSLETPLQLCNLKTTIRFVETHAHDIKTICS